MKTLSLSILSIVSTLLVACSGSSGSASNDSEDTANPTADANPTDTNSAPATDATVTIPAVDSTVTDASPSDSSMPDSTPSADTATSDSAPVADATCANRVTLVAGSTLYPYPVSACLDTPVGYPTVPLGNESCMQYVIENTCFDYMTTSDKRVFSSFPFKTQSDCEQFFISYYQQNPHDDTHMTFICSPFTVSDQPNATQLITLCESALNNNVSFQKTILLGGYTYVNTTICGL